MTKLSALTMAMIAAVALIVPATPAVAQSSITCGPLDNGRVADVFYKSNAVFFDPVVEYEYEAAVLTISGPCETITKTFEPGQEIVFDIREVERELDGSYQWELRFMPAVDPGVREDLQASRGTGEEDDLWWSLWQKGAIPDGPRVDSAGFSVVNGAIIDPNSGEERQKSATVATKAASTPLAAATAGFETSGGTSEGSSGSGGTGNLLATKDFVINDDLIVIGSQCLGFDCINGEVFSFDTLRLKENNLRIKFEDTSGGSFPTRDWEIEANSSANGGQTHFRINDVDAGRSPFTVEGSSPSHSLYVDSSGRVGFGTANPVVELHATDGDTPTLRLDQNTSSGFASQVWDVAGNETSFFIRDATNGSTLPFRIRPGASSNSLVIDSDDDVGVGTLSPSAPLHVVEGSSSEAARTVLKLENNGVASFDIEDTSGDGSTWTFETEGPSFRVNKNGSGGEEVIFRDRLDGTGNATMVVNGSVEATNVTFTSSREYKTGFKPVDTRQILDKVAALPMNEWQFKEEQNQRRHIGPVAEDFNAVFDLGGSQKAISVIDANGITMAAVQGLYGEVLDLREELKRRDQEIDRLEREKAEAFEQLRSRIDELEAAVNGASDR